MRFTRDVGSAQYRARAVRTLGAALAGALLLFAAAPAKADHPPTNVQVTAGNKSLAVTWTQSTSSHYVQCTSPSRRTVGGMSAASRVTDNSRRR